MGSSGAQQPVTQQTTQTKDPWIAAQPALQSAMGTALTLQQQGQGYQPYTGQTQAALDPSAATALGAMNNIATQNLGGSAGNLAAQGLATNMVQNQGLTPGLQSMLGQYNTLYNEASGQDNPYLQAMLDTSNRRIGDRVNSSVSGAGRYGSGAHTDIMSRALAESADPILAQDYARRQAQRMQATGAAGDIYGQGLQRAGQWAQLQPTLEAAQYAPAERMLGVGSYMQDRSQQAINDQIKQFNAQQAYQWENAARLNAIAGGAGALGGSQITTSPIQQPSSLQRLLGGGLAGAGIGSAFGGAPGAAIGAGAGGLLGLL